MTRSDFTPFRDPRNAVGLLTDVLEMALKTSGIEKVDWTTSDRREFGSLDSVHVAANLGHAFAKSPVTVLNGHKRRGHAKLYQQIKDALATLPGDTWLWGKEKRELLATVKSIAWRPLDIVVKVMENATMWERFSKSYTEQTLNGPVIQGWLREWQDHVSSAVRLGADSSRIHEREVEWRFRDLTDRDHRGRNVRDAFQAVWLTGNYKLAVELLKKDGK